MESLAAELTLDFKPAIIGNGGSPSDGRAVNLHKFISRLEEERLKIDAFKRELPLCMQLINNAMEAYRRELETCERREEEAPPPEEKSKWMVSAQIWSSPPQLAPPKDQESSIHNLDGKRRNGGAFIPFSRENGGLRPVVEPELGLGSSEKEKNKKNRSPMLEQEKTEGCPQTGSIGNGMQQPHRKTRRCWSPDLHRRFVNALQILGGSQAATPKQIRELMKVEGLTNDEVKSHLQKYRLHTRRPMSSTQATAAPPPHLVVLGGIWVPPEYAASTTGAAGIYSAHSGASGHYCSAPPTGVVTQEYYAATLCTPTMQVRHRGRSESREVEGERSQEREKEGKRDGEALVSVKETGISISGACAEEV